MAILGLWGILVPWLSERCPATPPHPRDLFISNGSKHHQGTRCLTVLVTHSLTHLQAELQVTVKALIHSGGGGGVEGLFNFRPSGGEEGAY